MPGIEDLNPRSRPVIELRRAVERALLLRDLCFEMEARGEPSPPIFGFDRWRHVKRSGFVKTAARQLFASALDTEVLWPVYFQYWKTGSLDRQITDLAANLPESVREKLGV